MQTLELLHLLCCLFFEPLFISIVFPKDTNELAAADVLVFIREAIQRFPDSELRDLILSKLLEVGEY